MQMFFLQFRIVYKNLDLVSVGGLNSLNLFMIMQFTFNLKLKQVTTDTKSASKDKDGLDA